MVGSRKRARSLDEGPSPLAVQIMSLRDMEELRHTELVTRLKLIQEGLGTTATFQKDFVPSKRLKLDINSTELTVPYLINQAVESPVQTSDNQFRIVMRTFMTNLIQSVIKEASRKATGSE